MMKNLQIITILAIFLFNSSCAIIGLNINRKTPKNLGKYPQFSESDTLRGKITKYKKVFDVSYYDISIDVNIKDKYIKGSVDIYFTALNDFDTIQIDLYDNYTLNEIIFESDSLAIQRKYNAVFVYFKDIIKKGESNYITVNYEGSPIKAQRPPWKGGFVWKKDKNNNPWIGVACENIGASTWWPLKDHLYDEPDSLQMNITIPKGLVCVSNGKLLEIIENNNKNNFIWKTRYPINSYNATIYIGDYKHFTLPYIRNDNIYNLDFYVLPYNLEKAKQHFKQASDIIHFFEEKIGPYPWWDEGYKLIESPYAGMEHQTAIAYGDKYKNQYGNDFDIIILHETAHEWFGNSLTAKDFAEIWLHEGFATYCEALYVEYTKGYEEYLNYLDFYSILIKNKRPIIGPYDVNYFDFKDGDVYFKGALLLHTLRNLINNDEIFFKIIRTFYNKFKYSFATTKDFIEIVHEKTNENYEWFFTQYLYSRICPQLEWNYIYENNSKQYEFHYKWNNVSSEFKLPIIIKTNDSEIKLYPSIEVQKINIKNEEPLKINSNNSYISLKKNGSL